jgi:hypothetical protein
MSTEEGILFRDADLGGYLRERDASMQAAVDRLESEYVLKVSLDDLTEHLTQKHRLEPVVLHIDQACLNTSDDTKLDVTHDPRYGARYDGQPNLIPATLVEFAVPFSGNAMVLRLAPSTFNFDPPRARIRGQELLFRYVRADHDAQAIRADFDRNSKNVAQYVAWGASQVEGFNKALQERIRQRLDCRKQKFLKDKGLVEALGFPIKPRAGAATTYSAPVTRKKLPIVKPTVAFGLFKPEPALNVEHYEHILSVISNMVLVMERSPQAFAQMGEEDLRTHILVQLNGHYEGQATGETFNYEGKTDILIRAEGRNVFIAECKFWKGAEAFKETIDQLLRYAAWRDTKTAIIIFNRNKDTSAVVQQIPSLVKAHPNFKREVATYQHETAFRSVLHHQDDKNKELTLTVQVFDVPS